MRRYQYDIPGRYDMVTFRDKRIRNKNFQQCCNIQAKILQSASHSRLKPNLSRFPSGGRENTLFFDGSDAASRNPAMRAPSPLRPKGMARSWA
jgi:hypothetical protein